MNSIGSATEMFENGRKGTDISPPMHLFWEVLVYLGS